MQTAARPVTSQRPEKAFIFRMPKPDDGPRLRRFQDTHPGTVIELGRHHTWHVDIYAHYYDRAQVVPKDSAFAYNSRDGGPQYFTMQNNRGIQVLSGFIESSGT